MDPKLQILKKLIDAQRIEQEKKKKEEELYTLSKEICEMKRNLSIFSSDCDKLRNENNSLEKEIANLRINKEIIDNEVVLLEKSIVELTEELSTCEREMYEEKENFWTQIDNFANDIVSTMDNEKKAEFEGSSERKTLVKKDYREKRLKLKMLQGKFRGLELLEKLQEKRLKQIEKVYRVIDQNRYS